LFIGLDSDLKNIIIFSTTAYYTEEEGKNNINNKKRKCYPTVIKSDKKWIKSVKNNTNKYLVCHDLKCKLSKTLGDIYVTLFIIYHKL